MPANNCIICFKECFGNKCQKCYLSNQKNNKGWFKKGSKSWNKDKNMKKLGYVNGMEGKKHSEESKIVMSKLKIRKYTGENNSNWQGGLSFEPYPSNFNKQIKLQILNRDNYTCQMCNIYKLKITKKEQLHIHHIDYDKNNCKLNNLLTLCPPCHGKTNFSRNYYKLNLMVGI